MRASTKIDFSVERVLNDKIKCLKEIIEINDLRLNKQYNPKIKIINQQTNKNENENE